MSRIRKTGCRMTTYTRPREQPVTNPHDPAIEIPRHCLICRKDYYFRASWVLTGKEGNIFVAISGGASTLM